MIITITMIMILMKACAIIIMEWPPGAHCLRERPRRGEPYDHQCADMRLRSCVDRRFSVSSEAGSQSASGWLSSPAMETSRRGHRVRGKCGCCHHHRRCYRRHWQMTSPCGSRQSTRTSWAARAEALSTWKRPTLILYGVGNAFFGGRKMPRTLPRITGK